MLNSIYLMYRYHCRPRESCNIDSYTHIALCSSKLNKEKVLFLVSINLTKENFSHASVNYTNNRHFLDLTRTIMPIIWFTKKVSINKKHIKCIFNTSKTDFTVVNDKKDLL